VCFDGACTACAQDSLCAPEGAPCATGVIDCSTGQPTCVANGEWPDGTQCDLGVCCGGACIACETTLPNAIPTCTAGACSVACVGGLTMCGGTCGDATSDARACGASCAVCDAGAICAGSTCSDVYGYPFQFQPCGNLSTGVAAYYLLAQPVTIPTKLTVTYLGAFGNDITSTVHGIMALYTDQDGAPSQLVAQTGSTTIIDGNNLIPIESPVTILAGQYWIAAEYDADAGLCTDESETNPVKYVPVTYGTMPTSFGMPTPLLTSHFNYYVVGTR
jgi:hypothetical protein